MKVEAQFKSELFVPFLSGDSQVNPECYGAELAWWLSRELAKLGVETSYPNSEDWGWFLDYIVGDDEFMLACANVARSKNTWIVFIEPYKRGFFSKTKPEIEVAKPLIEALEKLLDQNEGITEIQWEEHDA